MAVNPWEGLYFRSTRNLTYWKWPGSNADRLITEDAIFSGAAAGIESRTFTSSGIASASFASAKIESRTLSSAGITSVTWSGSDVGGTTESRTFSIAGVGAASFVSAAIAARTFSSAGSSVVSWVTSDQSASPSGGFPNFARPRSPLAREVARAFAEEDAPVKKAATNYVETLKADIQAADMRITELRAQAEAMRTEREAKEAATKAAKRAAKASRQAVASIDAQLAEIRAQVAANAEMEAQMLAFEAIRRAAEIQLEEIDVAYVALVLCEA